MTDQPLWVRALEPLDRDWVRQTLERDWHSVMVARKNELVDASTYPGFVASLEGERVGLAVYCVRGDEYEVLVVASTVEGMGVGRALMRQCFADARSRGCRRAWLITTNNNVRAIAFYQRLGMDLCAFHRGAVARSRILKPAISAVDASGIRIDHELEFELLLQQPPS